MADLQPIQFKRSFTSGSVPTSAQLLVGELAINFADRVIYSKNDSDIVVSIGSNYDSDIALLLHNYKASDSDLRIDFDSDIVVIYHNFKAADSDLRSDIDSDGRTIRHDFKAADSDLRTDMDSDFTVVYHDYKAADSDLRADIDSDGRTIRHDFKAADSDLRADMDSDFTVVYHDYKAADSDLRIDMDSDFRVVYHDYKAADSDLRTSMDSDFTVVYHDYKAADSDLRTSMDSDFTVVYHDYQAADSDLRSDIDSDGLTIRHDFKAADSDLRIDMDSDFTVVYHDYKAADSDLFTEVQKILDSDLPTIIHNYLAADSDQTLSSLNDVATDLPSADYILAWDSDSELWKPKPYSLVGPGKLYRQQFYAVSGQTEFGPLVYTPKGDVVIYRNGIALPFEAASYNISTNKVTYVPAGNFNNTLDSDDDIIVDYMYSSSVYFGTRVADLWDVSSSILNNEHHNILTWDSDVQLWVPRKTVGLNRYSEQFIATQGQSQFVLSHVPSADVLVARNGIIIPSAAFTLDSDTVTYIPANNQNAIIDSDDDIIIDYFTGENAVIVQEAYVPSTPSDWSAPAPTTTSEAIDRLAALLKTLNGGTGA